MGEIDLEQGAWARGWRDTKEIHSNPLIPAGEAILGMLIGGWWFPLVMAGIAIGVFAAMTALAPLRQRDEVRSRLRGALADSPRLTIRIRQVKLSFGDDGVGYILAWVSVANIGKRPTNISGTGMALVLDDDQNTTIRTDPIVTVNGIHTELGWHPKEHLLMVRGHQVVPEGGSVAGLIASKVDVELLQSDESKLAGLIVAVADVNDTEFYGRYEFNGSEFDAPTKYIPGLEPQQEPADMPNLKEAHEKGKLDKFIEEHENDPPGNLDKLEEVLKQPKKPKPKND